MSNKTWILIVVGVIAVLGLLILLKPKSQTQNQTHVNQNTQSASPSASAQTTKTFELVIRGKKLVSGPETLSVKEGETVTIKITSDEPEEFHLHGYDRSVDLEKNQQIEMSFVANLTGRFEYELEKSKIAIGALEVLPK